MRYEIEVKPAGKLFKKVSAVQYDRWTQFTLRTAAHDQLAPEEFAAFAKIGTAHLRQSAGCLALKPIVLGVFFENLLFQ